MQKTVRHLLLSSTAILSLTVAHSQTINLDSCGFDSSPFLNKYEIHFVDSFLFQPFATKKALIDPKDGFDFASKKIAFYSCTLNSDTKGRGFMTKQRFFDLIKPTPKGHAGIGLIKFNDSEKTKANGFDAVIIIDCPYFNIDKQQLILKLAESN